MVSSGAGLSAVAIVGPTAVGKSDVADRLARHGHRYRKDGAR